MIHGTHFMVSASDAFPDGKIWGPWLWYLNDGSKQDAEKRAKEEFTSWPYEWLKDEAYQSRGSVKGQLVLSDGRPGANAAVFLGDNNPNKTALDMGSDYYYTSYADSKGRFEFIDVRTATYGLQAWSNGSKIADVTTSFLRNDVTMTKPRETLDLGRLTWDVSKGTKIFQVGDFDRTSYGFRYGGAPNQHALVANCPADLVYQIGKSKTSDWCFGQTYLGNWTISFDLPSKPKHQKPTRSNNAKLIVSLAGYSSGASSTIWANGHQIGNLTSGTPDLLNDPSLYRSMTTAGEWRYFEFDFDAEKVLKEQGENEITFELAQNTTWHGFMWDSIVLEW